jgi:hypothetical protein
MCLPSRSFFYYPTSIRRWQNPVAPKAKGRGLEAQEKAGQDTGKEDTEGG